MLGGPGETPQTLAETINFAKEIDPDCIGTALGIRIYPETEIADIAQQIEYTGGTSSKCINTFAINQAEEFECRTSGPLFTLLPLLNSRWAGVQVTGKNCLAGSWGSSTELYRSIRTQTELSLIFFAIFQRSASLK